MMLASACEDREATSNSPVVINPAVSIPPSSTDDTSVVTGELLKIEDSMFILKDREGREQLLKTQTDTIVDEGLQRGDAIIVHIGETGQALAIQKRP